MYDTHPRLFHIVNLAAVAAVGPLHYSNYGCAVSEGSVGVFADIRGYGHLSKGRTEDASARIQDARGQLVVAVIPVAAQMAAVVIAAAELLDYTEPRADGRGRWDVLREAMQALDAGLSAGQPGGTTDTPSHVWERDRRGNV